MLKKAWFNPDSTILKVLLFWKMRKRDLISFEGVWAVKNTCADTSRKCCNICCAFQLTLVHTVHVNRMKHAQAIGLGGILQLVLLILFSNLAFCEDFLQNFYMTNEWNELQSCIAETSNAANRICQHELKSVQQIAPRCYRRLELLELLDVDLLSLKKNTNKGKGFFSNGPGRLSFKARILLFPAVFASHSHW